jgi:hypothetical protein
MYHFDKRLPVTVASYLELDAERYYLQLSVFNSCALHLINVFELLGIECVSDKPF